MYPNLLYLIKLNGITQKDLAWALHLCRNSIGNKMHRYTQWKEREMREIQRLLAPDLPLEVIFGQKFTLSGRRKRII